MKYLVISLICRFLERARAKHPVAFVSSSGETHVLVGRAMIWHRRTIARLVTSFHRTTWMCFVVRPEMCLVLHSALDWQGTFADTIIKRTCN